MASIIHGTLAVAAAAADFGALRFTPLRLRPQIIVTPTYQPGHLDHSSRVTR